MNKKMKLVLASVLCVSTGYAKQPSNKTFLMPRDQLMDMARDFTTWHNAVDKNNCPKKDKDLIGARVCATGWYIGSCRRKSVGQYFGFSRCSQDGAQDCDGDCPAGERNADCQDGRFFEITARQIEDQDDANCILFPQDILHDSRDDQRQDPRNANLNPLAEKIEFLPELEMWGVTLNYRQNLDTVTHGLYFNVKTPIVYAANTMGARCSGEGESAKTIEAVISNQDGSKTEVKREGDNAITVFDYLSGNLTQAHQADQDDLDPAFANVMQAALTHARIVEKRSNLKKGSHTCTSQRDTVAGLGDVRVDLGYNFYDEKFAHVGLAFNFVVPTGGAPEGKTIFESVIGNGGHLETGATLDAHYDWSLCDGQCSFGLHSALNYMYAWESTEKRTLGFKDRKDGLLDCFGHYKLGGRQGKPGVFPLANVLTQKVNVEPGNNVELLTAMSFDWRGLTFDLGYDFFWKDKENVGLKAVKEGTWPRDENEEDGFAVASFNYNTIVDGDLHNFDIASDALEIDGQRERIRRSDLSTSAAQTPKYASHKLFSGIGYTFDNWNTPLFVGSGAHYEWGDGRQSLNTWSTWLKLGLSF